MEASAVERHASSLDRGNADCWATGKLTNGRSAGVRVAISGHNGYIGSVLTPTLLDAGHSVTGLDTFFYEECTYGPEVPQPPAIRKDIRDVRAEDLRGFDAVIHLAALSNDPLGDLRPEITYDIN